MTSWAPDLAAGSGPRYLAIADALAADVGAGRLQAGDRLPTHRELAWKLGVTVGTVTRAYAEAERRGLIAGEVGRGTFIRQRGVDQPNVVPIPAAEGFIDLSRNYPPTAASEPIIAAALREVVTEPSIAHLLGYQNNAGIVGHRTAAAEWIARTGIDARPDDIVIVSGAQQGMMLALHAAARPGDLVLAEQLTYYGMKSLAALLSLRLQGLAMDEHGIKPDALDAACGQGAPKLLYTIPTLQNPTNSVMPAERRAEIVAICRRHGVLILEDDIYGFLPEELPPPLATLAPEQTIYVTSLSKCAAPGLRIGYVRAPAALVDRIAAGMRATTWMATPLLAETATRLIRNGGLDRLVAWQRREAAERQQLAKRVLKGLDFAAHPSAFHIWLDLPEPWRREELVAAAARRGVGVAAADAFAVGRVSVPHRVRVGISAAQDQAQLERALTILREILCDVPEQGFPVV